RIADKKKVGACAVGKTREREIVGRHHRELALAFGGQDGRNSYLGVFEARSHCATSCSSREGVSVAAASGRTGARAPCLACRFTFDLRLGPELGRAPFEQCGFAYKSSRLVPVTIKRIQAVRK